MRHLLLILLSIALILSCKDERTGSERALETLSIYLLSRPDLLRPNFCEPPQLILEEGQTYNITLEEGKRFWFDYAVRLNGTSKSNFKLTINKEIDTFIDYQIKSCSISNDQGTREIVSSSPTQVVYESESFNIDYPGSSNIDARFFIESKTISTNVSLFFLQF